MFGRAAWPSFSIERGTPTIALDVHLQDCGVMHEAIDGGEGHGLVGEDFAPFTERLVAVMSIDRRS